MQPTPLVGIIRNVCQLSAKRGQEVLRDLVVNLKRWSNVYAFNRTAIYTNTAPVLFGSATQQAVTGCSHVWLPVVSLHIRLYD